MFNFFKKRDSKEKYFLQVTSASTWDRKERWESLLTYYHAIFGGPKLKLDVDDPLRRPYQSVSENASYIAEKMAAGESSIFGEFSTKASFTIENARPDPLEGAYSRLVLTVPHLNDPSKLLEILDKTAVELEAFYGFAETETNFLAWKKKKVDWGIDYARELPGIMWHTFFSRSYIDYFGADKFEPFSPKWTDQGVIITLSFGSTRQRLKEGDRAAKIFGVKSFVDHFKILPDQKEYGEHVLSMTQIRSHQG